MKFLENITFTIFRFATTGNIMVHAHRVFTILLFCLVKFGVSSFARTASITYTSRIYTVKDGLPSNLVTSLLQDNQGYLWAGTKSSIARFDGKTFNIYDQANGLTQGINTISQLIDGRILVCTNSGLQYISNNNVSKLFTVDKYSFYFSSGALVGNTYYLIAQSSEQDKLTTKKEETLLAFDTRTNSFRKKTILKNCRRNIFSISKDSAIVFSYNYEDSISYYQLLTNDSLYPRKTMPFKLKYCSNRASYLNGICADMQGNYYTVTTGKNGVEFKSHGQATDMDSHDFAYFQRNENTLYYHDKDFSLIRSVDGKSEKLLRTDVIWSSIQDSYGNTWFATEEGLVCFYNFAFRKYNWNFNHAKNDDVWSQTQTSDGLLWLNNYTDGLYVYDVDKNQFHLSSSANFQKKKKFLLYYHPVVKHDTIYYPSSNAILILKNDQVVGYKSMPTPLLYMYDDSLHKQVLSAGWGIFSISKELKISEYKSAAELKTGLSFILCMTRDGEGNLWYTTSRNTGFIDSKGLCHLVTLPDNVSFSSMLCDHRGTLWLGGSNGLWYYNRKQFRKIPNLQIKQIVGLHEYKSKKLILSSNGQLHILDLGRFYSGDTIVYSYTSNLGYTGENGSQNSILEDNSGYIWINAKDAVYRFHPDSLKTVSAPVPNLQTIVYSRDLINWQPVSGNTTLTRPSNSLKFCYGTPSLNFSGDLYYQYRIDGLHEWSAPTKETSINYFQLPAGNYFFEVRASIDGIHWSKSARSGTITICAAWYESVLFYVGVISFCCAISIIVILYLTRHSREKNKRAAQLAKHTLNSLRSKLLPHFTNNVQVHIIGLIREGENDNAIMYTKKLSKLNRKIIEASEKSFHSLAAELEFLRDYLLLQQICYGNKLQFTIEVDGDVDTLINVPVMALQLFTENAIKHGLFHDGRTGHIEIKASNQENGVEISVRDNGIGRERASKMNIESTRIGLKTFTDTVSIFNQLNKQKIVLTIVDLNDEQTQPGGTITKLFIPYHYIYY